MTEIGRKDYEERRAARIERLRARAEEKRVEAHQRLTKNDALLGVMAGTPILIGHHSEKRHRRDLARIDNDMRKGFESSREAEQLDRRAAFAEANTAISSDDPDALTKLRAKLEKIERDRETMKRANAAIRKAQRLAKGQATDEVQAIVVALGKELGWPEATARKLATPDFAGRIGFADYELTNRSAEVRRLKQRIAQLEQQAARAERPEETIGDVRICEAENRVQMHFPGKPDEQTRAALKGAGFRWAPSSGAWQRLATENAWAAARRIVGTSRQSP